ncbi:MAG TPA: GntR family transcriptional regulator [bacterium]|nr:GntR family transcriptional regulator [bacterium]HOM27562.1 GntR family transcriptional regulator [bacterium]
MALYKKIRDDIKEKIEKGEYKVGEKIPSISELSKIYNVSDIVVKQALKELIKEGLLIGVQGRGVFVKEKENEKIIGVIFTDIVKNPFFAEIYTGIEKVFSSNGYHIIVGVSYNNVEKEKKILKEFIERKVSGIIMTPTEVNRTSSDNNIFYELKERRIPFIFVDRTIEDIETDYVTSDNFKGGYIATKYLISLGHRRIGIILGINANTVRERLQGYKKALEEENIEFDPMLVKRSYTELQYDESGYTNTKELLHLKNPPTAIFATNDPIAFGVYKTCIEMDIKIPDDLSVIGFDKAHFSSILNPVLTTIEQKTEEIGEKASEILIKRINGDKSPIQKIILDVNIVEGFSCKKLFKKINVKGGAL